MTNAMKDPRQNLSELLAHIERAECPVSAPALARAMGAPWWQIYRALCHLRAMGKVVYIAGEGWALVDKLQRMEGNDETE